MAEPKPDEEWTERDLLLAAAQLVADQMQALHPLLPFPHELRTRAGGWALMFGKWRGRQEDPPSSRDAPVWENGLYVKPPPR